MKKTLITAILLLGSMLVSAQELKCDVRVNSNQLAGSDKSAYQNLQTALYEFLNNTKFTDINFKQNERVECSILVDLKQREGDTYTAEISVASNRPIYKSNYNAPIINYIDRKFLFEYMDGQPIDFNPNTYMSNLTSVVGFYVYVILGLDFDSFSPNGGDPFFAIAERVASAAPQEMSGDNGWNTSGRQNRHTIISDINSQSYKQLREFMYEYHRLGLDVMSEKPEQGREVILNALSKLQAVYERNSMCYFLQLIIEAKRDEIIQVFSQGNQKEKTEACNIMKAIDPSQSSRYDAILQNPSR